MPSGEGGPIEGWHTYHAYFTHRRGGGVAFSSARASPRLRPQVEKKFKQFEEAKKHADECKDTWMASIFDRVDALQRLTVSAEALDRVKAERAPK